MYCLKISKKPQHATGLRRLQRIIENLGPLVLAFSGGVDSTLLAAVCRRLLGNNFLAVTVFSPFFPEREKKAAARLAEQLHIPHAVIRLKLPKKLLDSNPRDRCYRCKRLLFLELRRFAARKGFTHIIEGSNQDDLKDFRPGAKALRQMNIISPLQEAGLTKAQIRMLAKKMGLENWEKPASSCLATRIPYHVPITYELLHTIDCAEHFLQKRGFRQCRVRCHGSVCRIETNDNDLSRMLQYRDSIVRKMKQLGFGFVTLDLEGYKKGSFNQVIWKKRK